MAVLEFEYTLTEQNYIDFNIIHQRTSKLAQRNSLIFALIFLGIGGLYTFIQWNRSQSLRNVISFAALYSVFAAGIFLMRPFMTRLSIRGAVKAMLKEGTNRDLLGQKKMQLTDTQILLETALSRSESSLDVITRTLETKGYILAYIGAIQAYIFPKTIAETDQIREWLKATGKPYEVNLKF